MYKYTKIETPFVRDMDGSKKLIEGRFRSEAVEFLKDNEWICTEKIDGTNIGIVWDGNRVSYQGKTERANIPAHLMNKLIELFGGEVNEEIFEQQFGDTSVILFGEGYGSKIQNGGKYRNDVSFILFDAYVPSSNLWLRRDALEDIATSLGIDIVPEIIRGTLQDAIDFVKQRPMSTIGTAPMEGLVCKPAVDILDRRGNRIITKIKVNDFA